MARIDDAINSLTPDELDLLTSDPQMLSEFKAKYAEPQPTIQPEKGLIQKGWDALAVPEKMSREGLTEIANAIPSAEPNGNMLHDVALNTPKAIAETLAQTAPGFVSRASLIAPAILQGGKTAAPAIKGVGKAAANFAEQLSGLEYKTPGVLSEAAKDPMLIFGKGTDTAGTMYKNLVDTGRIRSEFAQPLSPKEVVDKALEYANDGSLTPEEALIARRSLDSIRKKVADFGFRATRQVFDQIAKTKSAEADQAFQRAVKSEALRTPFAINKTGGASAFKLGLGFLTKTLPFTSPLAQGALATGTGALGKVASAMAENPIQNGLGSVSVLENLANLLANQKGGS